MGPTWRTGARAQLRVRAVAGHVAPHFSGTSVAVRPTYQVQIKRLEPGLRESIRDVRGQPTNCDECKPWMGDIAANAAKKGIIKPYGWYAPSEPPAFVRLAKPLAQCRVGLISTSGCYIAGDRAYFGKEDASSRTIPSDTPLSQLRFSHVTENYLTDGRRDPSCLYPLETLRRLVADGIIGSLPDDVFSCMGANYSARTVLGNLAPSVAEKFAEQKVDAVLVVPM